VPPSVDNPDSNSDITPSRTLAGNSQYIAALGIAGKPDAPLFRTAAGKTGELIGNGKLTSASFASI
jgi:hypothetical protein